MSRKIHELAKSILKSSDGIKIKPTRSSGSGGQNVNKVSSKAELYFKIPESKLLDEEQKELLIDNLT